MKEIYEERSIAVFLSRLDVMRFSAGMPELFIHRIGVLRGIREPHVLVRCGKKLMTGSPYGTMRPLTATPPTNATSSPP
jgi:hypothetical protein